MAKKSRQFLGKFWHIWDEDLCGYWTENKLLSRKWLLVFVVVFIAIFADLAKHELGANTTQIITIVVPSFIAIQGFIDMAKYRFKQQQKRKDQRESRMDQSSGNPGT